MTSCSQMKMDQVYYCEDCGLELKVVKECDECGTETSSSTTCGCTEQCSFECCGEPMKLRD
jgi:hypothetical protein